MKYYKTIFDVQKGFKLSTIITIISNNHPQNDKTEFWWLFF